MKTKAKPSAHGKKAEHILRKAVAEVVEQHRRLGLPLAVMSQGKAVLVPTDKVAAMKRALK